MTTPGVSSIQGVGCGGPHQEREEIELRCEAVGGDPTGPPLAGLPPVLRGVWGVRTFVCCAVNVCVLVTQKCSLSDLPRDRLNTSPRKDRVL